MAIPDHRQRRVFHLNIRMAHVRPISAYFLNLAHQPGQHVQLMRRLIDQYPATLGRPLAPPRITPVVGLITPTQHEKRRQHGQPDLARVNCRLHAQYRIVPAPLADHAELGACLACGFQHQVAIGQRRRHRLFHQRVHTVLRRCAHRLGMQRMRRANRYGIH